jgi:hypothetical protein
MQKFIVATTAASALAGSIEVVSTDLSQGNRGLGNIKGQWSQTLSLFGQDATVAAEYDRAEKEDGPTEVSLSGSNGDINFKVKQADGARDLTLSTKSNGVSVEANLDESGLKSVDFSTEQNGVNLEASLDSSGLKSVDLSTEQNGVTLAASGGSGGIDTVTASGDVDAGSQNVNYELEHTLASGDSKLKLSSVLGNGLKAIANIARSKNGDMSTDYNLEYETELQAGRTVSARINGDGSGDIELEDTTTLSAQEATIVANMDLGGSSPSVTVKRSWAF